MSFTSDYVLSEQLAKVFTEEFNIPKSEILDAAHAAWKEQEHFRNDMYAKGAEVLRYLKETGKHGIVLAASIPR